MKLITMSTVGENFKDTSVWIFIFWNFSFERDILLAYLITDYYFSLRSRSHYRVAFTFVQSFSRWFCGARQLYRKRELITIVEALHFVWSQFLVECMPRRALMVPWIKRVSDTKTYDLILNRTAPDAIFWTKHTVRSSATQSRILGGSIHWGNSIAHLPTNPLSLTPPAAAALYRSLPCYNSYILTLKSDTHTRPGKTLTHGSSERQVCAHIVRYLFFRSVCYCHDALWSKLVSV